MGVNMTEFIKTQNSFAHGEVAPEFYARDGINGLSKLENMDVLASGALSRRCGLTSVAHLPSDARLVSFSVSDGNEYILALMNERIYVYQNNVRIKDIISPWKYEDIKKLQYAQRFSTMIFVHPNYPPYVLEKTDSGFSLSKFIFEGNTNLTANLPFVKFDDAADVLITVTTSNQGNNYATFTTNKNFWVPESVGGRLFLLNNQWLITEYISPTQIIAYINGVYTRPEEPVADWYESAFSNRRGWPSCITFHQNRLVFAGTPSWPSGVWMSQVGHHRNFNTGTGLDDEAIFVSLLSQERQQICTLVSSDNLQILTNSGEWAISNKPLTPSSVNVKQHTSVGTYMSRYLPPQKIEGATVFVSANGRDIRELSLDELGEKYNANDLCALAKHLMQDPVDMAYNSTTRQLFVVKADGNLAVLNQNASLGISAWSEYKTQGIFLSVSVSDEKTYVVVQRNNNIYLERFDKDAMFDAEQYGFAFTAAGLPLRNSKHNASRIKVRKISARLIDTKSISINHYRITLPNEVYEISSKGFSGDVSVNLLGTTHNAIQPLWKIHGSEPYAVSVLSVTAYGWYIV